MALSQMYALTGTRRYKEPYVEAINARKQYLPALYQQRSLEDYRNKMYGVQQQGLQLSKDALKEQEQANKRARLLGYANIGLGAGLGVAGLASDLDLFNKFKATEQISEPIADLTPDLSSLGQTISSAAQVSPSDVSDATSYLGDIWDYGTGDVLKNIGGGLFDVGQSIYGSVAGDYLSFDSSGLSDVDWSGWDLY